MTIVAKKTILTLYTDPQDPYSHQVRIVLAEKGVHFEVYTLTPNEHIEDLAAINPYYSAPTLVDRELVLYDANIIIEYLDERFPHPPLLPVYPVARAESRTLIYRVKRDWYTLMNTILQGGKDADSARLQLREGLSSLDPLFADKPFFLSNDFSLVDCCLAPLLWRFPLLGIEWAQCPKNLNAYAQRLFERPSFQASLTDAERELAAA